MRSYGFRVLLALILSGCATDAHIPPFARMRYEPFSREAVIAIALREWRAFGSPVQPTVIADKPERAEGLWQRVGEYWWLGLDPSQAEAAWTGKHDAAGRVFPPEQDETYAWSAVFVSYVMRMAGAGSGFPYAAGHDVYIRAAFKGDPKLVVAAERPEAYAPRPGDLICAARGRDSHLRFGELGHTPVFISHCDIVVDTGGPQGLSAIGGNVSDTVAMRHLPVTSDGRLAGDGWLAVLRLREPTLLLPPR